MIKGNLKFNMLSYCVLPSKSGSWKLHHWLLFDYHWLSLATTTWWVIVNFEVSGVFFVVLYPKWIKSAEGLEGILIGCPWLPLAITAWISDNMDVKFERTVENYFKITTHTNQQVEFFHSLIFNYYWSICTTW